MGTTDLKLQLTTEAVGELVDEIRRLRGQRDQLMAANNRLLEERRTAELVPFLITKAQWSKHAKNEARKWPAPASEDLPVEHDRSEE